LICFLNQTFFFFVSVSRRQPDIPNNNQNDELSSVRNRNERDRPENDKTRRPYRHSGESGEYTPILNTDPIIQTFVTTPTVDSNLGSSMPTSTYNLQLDEHVKRIQDENNSLKKVKKKTNKSNKSILLFLKGK